MRCNGMPYTMGFYGREVPEAYVRQATVYAHHLWAEIVVQIIMSVGRVVVPQIQLVQLRRVDSRDTLLVPLLMEADVVLQTICVLHRPALHAPAL